MHPRRCARDWDEGSKAGSASGHGCSRFRDCPRCLDWDRLGAALGIELVTVIGACGYYLLGSRDSDVGALFGSRPDERQASIGMRAIALTVNVLILVAIGGVVIATATGISAWPFFLFCSVGAATFLIGLFIYGDR
jgi:hypothetical protein